MSQLVYAFVARGTTVLAEYNLIQGSYQTVAVDCLRNLQERMEPKFTITADRHTFNFLNDAGYTFLVVADESFGRTIPFACLERIRADFIASYGEKGKVATAHTLDKLFGKNLKSHMEYSMSHPEDISKVAAVQKQVSEVQSIMVQNIESVLERGQKLDDLQVKAEDLRDQATEFKRGAGKVKKAMWWQNFRMKLIIIFIIIIVAVIIFCLVCFTGGKNCFSS